MKAQPATTSIDSTVQDVKSRRTSSRAVVEAALEKIHQCGSAGKHVFLELRDDIIRAQSAVADDTVISTPDAAGSLCGVPISIKDLFDVRGEVTGAGSRCMKRNAPATDDALVVRRLREAGAVLFGRTNMTELAYSGLGLNPHFGTPRNPHDRDVERIPGGSSSGAAVAVALGMSIASIGTDTGGSCRIPAALCGTVGFKPTHGRISVSGVVPLAPSYDSVGSFANTVVDCAMLDAVMAGQQPVAPAPLALNQFRFAVPRDYVLDNADDEVANAFDSVLSALTAAGANIAEISLSRLAELSELGRDGGIVAIEAAQNHQELITRRGSEIDPRVRQRIEIGMRKSPTEYQEFHRLRQSFMKGFWQDVSKFDGLLMPTVPLLAPPLAELEDDEAYYAMNSLIIRNTVIANVLGSPAISLPCGHESSLPVGFMLMMPPHEDQRLFGVARTIEHILN